MSSLASATQILLIEQQRRREQRPQSPVPRVIELTLDGDRVSRPGKTAELAFTARAAGRFAVETHRPDGRHAALLYLEVLPR